MITPFLHRFRFFPAFALLACAVGTNVRAQTTMLLDDFSTDKFNSASPGYVQKQVPNGPGTFFGSGGWNVAGGQMLPTSANPSVGGYAAWVWTGNSLQNIGDSFSVDLVVTNTGGDHNAGLSLWTSNTATFDRLLEPRLSFDGSSYTWVSNNPSTGLDYAFAAGSPGVAFTSMNLKLSLVGRGDGNDSEVQVEWNFTGNVPETYLTHTFTLQDFSGPLFVGPSAWQGDGSNIAFDNFTYSSSVSAIPEPSTYAAIFGAAALGLAVWQRRRVAAPAHR